MGAIRSDTGEQRRTPDYGWVDGSMDPWIHGSIDGLMNEWMDPWLHGYMVESMDAWIDGHSCCTSTDFITTS